MENRIEQSIADYAASLRSNQRKDLLKVLAKSIPKRERDVDEAVCPNLYKRLLLSCAEDIIQNDEKENFGIAIVALGNGSDWEFYSEDYTFEKVQLRIARHTCLSLVTHSGSVKRLEEFLCLLPVAWGQNGVIIAKRLIEELIQVIDGLVWDSSSSKFATRKRKYIKEYIKEYGDISTCWGYLAPWFWYQRSRLSRPFISSLIKQKSGSFADETKKKLQPLIPPKTPPSNRISPSKRKKELSSKRKSPLKRKKEAPSKRKKELSSKRKSPLKRKKEAPSKRKSPPPKTTTTTIERHIDLKDKDANVLSPELQEYFFQSQDQESSGISGSYNNVDILKKWLSGAHRAAGYAPQQKD